MTNCPLVMIEWEDSRQPTSEWRFLSSFDPETVVRCASVGWLIHDGADFKALAPNMGDVLVESSVQVSGVIRIPTRCILNMVGLNEAEESTSSSDPGPSFHPGSTPTQQAS